MDKKRCIVLADGFFEWQRADRKNKRPHYVRTGESEPMVRGSRVACGKKKSQKKHDQTF